MTTWFHLEHTDPNGTTWRTSQPIPSQQAAVEYVKRILEEGSTDIKLTRHAD